MRKCQQKLLKNWGYRYVRTRVIAFPKIGKVAPQATDECAPIPRAIRLRTLITRSAGASPSWGSLWFGVFKLRR